MGSFCTSYDSPLGKIEIRGNEKAIESILFVENVAEESTEVPKVGRNCIQQLDNYFQGKQRSFDFPMEPAGTDFQQTVWKELQQIPFGKTIDYLTLSKRLGDPKKIRAAASANGKNPLAIVIPCHRVIGSDGTLVGYAGGLAKKQWLLEHEAKLANGVATLF